MLKIDIIKRESNAEVWVGIETEDGSTGFVLTPSQLTNMTVWLSEVAIHTRGPGYVQSTYEIG